jgi:hypothetical protein
MDRRQIKVAAVAPANKIARVAWNEEIGQELHTVPFIRPVAQLEASILDLNLMLRHRAAGNASIASLSWRGVPQHGVADPVRRVDQLGCRDYRIGALADVQQRNGFAVAVGAGRIAGRCISLNRG